MNNKLRFDFDVSDDNKSVTVIREFAAPLARVWEAWTHPRILDQWWAPKPWKAETKELNFAVGGRWLYAMKGPDGTEHWSQAIYSAIDAPRSYSYDDAFCDADGNITDELPGSHWDVSFSESDRVTTVRILISHRTAEDLENIMKMGFREGSSMGLGNLDDVLMAGA